MKKLHCVSALPNSYYIEQKLGCFTVQFSVTKGWGVIKTYYVPEEDDIQNVLQTVFENY